MITSEEKVRIIVKAADDKQAREMVLLNLSGLTMMTDYFFICSGSSNVHMRTITDNILEAMKHAGMGGIRVEGYESAQWILLDYGDIVVHVMAPEQREYYGLEHFWNEAEKVPISSTI